MTEAMRSATALVDKILSDPSTIEALQHSPEKTLRLLEAQINKQMPPPTGKVVNLIWLIVVLTFSAVLLYSVVVLGTGVSQELKENVQYATRSDTMLTVVTTVVGFLAGLLAPSPISKGNNGS